MNICKRIAVLLGVALAIAALARKPTSAQPTPFNPISHGFAFSNGFKNDVISGLNFRSDGLCGGMSYAALDFYYAGKTPPNRPVRPANRTPLHSYIYQRQVESLASNADKWGEVIMTNTFGWRNTEFFNWGISAKSGERIDELRSFLDKGQPCVLGLKGDGSTGDHQVVAYAYTMGRYKGDLGDFVEDFSISIYDPNYPQQTRTLAANRERQLFYYREGGGETWRTYFVDRKYRAKTPPDLPGSSYPDDGLAHELMLEFATGNDDLRGGNDNIDLFVNVADGTQQIFRNINNRGRWLENHTETATVVLNPAVSWDHIVSLEVGATFRGGTDGDNWDMASLAVGALGGGYVRPTLRKYGSFRFTGHDKNCKFTINEVRADPTQATSLVFSFYTSNDNLRGGNDNLNVSIIFRDARNQRQENLNDAKEWHDWTLRSRRVDLNRAIHPRDIVRFDFDTTFGGGMGGDNWNMACVAVRAIGAGFDYPIAYYGGKRFTGSDKTLSVNLAGDGVAVPAPCPPPPPAPAPRAAEPRRESEGRGDKH